MMNRIKEIVYRVYIATIRLLDALLPCSRFSSFVQRNLIELKTHLKARRSKRAERPVDVYSLPVTLQLPITYKCNFDCAMCGMRTLQGLADFSPEQLRTILTDKLFKNIASVGVNGGEPFIKENLLEYIEALLDSLPNLKDIFIITNGFFTKRTLDYSQKIKSMCKAKGVRYTLSVSIDGVGDVHNKIRQNKKAFENASGTLEAIAKDTDRYCDEFGAICTITKKNIYNVNEVLCWGESTGIPVSYNIATIHTRLNNSYKFEDFSVFTDKHALLLATEFFYSLYYKTHRENYFTLYYYLRTGKRISDCWSRYSAVTLTPNCQISYCATCSKELGNALETSAGQLFFDNVDYRQALIAENCETCSHYSSAVAARFHELFEKEEWRTLYY